jgi:hypothetical protein
MKNSITLLLFLTIVTFTSNAQTDCYPATIINVEREGSGNRAVWTMPTGDEEVTISQQSGNFYYSTGVPEDFGIYHRFIPEDLATINGGKLTQVVFVPAYIKVFQTEPGHTYTLQIYKGGTWGGGRRTQSGYPCLFSRIKQ